MHRIYGIDLGTQSVKIVAHDVGFRTSRLALTATEPVAAGEAPLVERQAAAVKAAVGTLSSEASLYCAISGDVLSLRNLELPFTDARKIEQVLGFELEGQIVHALDDVVYDHVVLETRHQGSIGSTVLAAAARRDDVAALIAALGAQGLEPRAIYAGPLVYQALLPKNDQAAAALAAEGLEETRRSQMVLDIGHQRTNVCIVRDGRAVFGRTIRRGGAQLTQALADAFKLGLPEAEDGKRRRAFLAGPERPAVTPVDQKIDTVLREALQPLVRELRQTLASRRATAKDEPGVVLLAGGGARLQGLPGFLEQELGIPVLPLDVPVRGQDETVHDAVPNGSSSWAAAAAVASTALHAGREIDLRRGQFVYRANFSVLRQRAMRLSMALAAVLLAAGLNAWASMSRLQKEKTALDAQLKTATQELFGEPRTDARAVAQLLKKGFKEEMVPLPKATAFDLLDQISRKVPAASETLKLDVMELDIRPKKTFIKGTVSSAAAVDDIATKLKDIDCYDDVAKGAVTEVSDGNKQFTLTISSRCP